MSLTLSSVSEMLCFIESKVSSLLDRCGGIPLRFFGLLENKAPNDPSELLARNKLPERPLLAESGPRRDFLKS